MRFGFARSQCHFFAARERGDRRPFRYTHSARFSYQSEELLHPTNRSPEAPVSEGNCKESPQEMIAERTSGFVSLTGGVYPLACNFLSRRDSKQLHRQFHSYATSYHHYRNSFSSFHRVWRRQTATERPKG